MSIYGKELKQAVVNMYRRGNSRILISRRYGLAYDEVEKIIQQAFSLPKKRIKRTYKREGTP